MKKDTAYTWADAWFLLAVSYVSPNGQAVELSTVIGSADYINHAILTHNEIATATSKLLRGGWITFENGKYAATEQMVDKFSELPAKSAMSQLTIVESWLDAVAFDEAYDPNVPTCDPFPGISQADVDQAVANYKQ